MYSDDFLDSNQWWQSAVEECLLQVREDHLHNAVSFMFLYLSWIFQLGIHWGSMIVFWHQSTDFVHDSKIWKKFVYLSCELSWYDSWQICWKFHDFDAHLQSNNASVCWSSELLQQIVGILSGLLSKVSEKTTTEHLFRKFQVIEYQSSEFSSGGLIHKNIVIGSENWRSGLSILTLIFRHSCAILWRYYHLEILKQLSHTAASLKFLFDSNFQNSDKKWKSANNISQHTVCFIILKTCVCIYKDAGYSSKITFIIYL